MKHNYPVSVIPEPGVPGRELTKVSPPLLRSVGKLRSACNGHFRQAPKLSFYSRQTRSANFPLTHRLATAMPTPKGTLLDIRI